MSEISKCCHYLYVIDQGRIVNSGVTNQLISQHIHTFSITGNHLSASKTLQSYEVKYGINDAKVICHAKDIPALLQNLLNEGIEVTACTPDLTLEELIKTPAV